MQCLHPHTRTYVDLAGNTQVLQYPCGHCIACLVNQHNSWYVRMRHECIENSSFIYDTLTFSNENLPCHEVNCHELDDIGYDLLRILDKYYLYTHTDTGEMFYRIPCVTRSLIRDWIKRGRELYYYDTGERLEFKYFIVMEYGPTSSRPHFHLLLWGLKPWIYRKYFGRPWEQRYGFTKFHYIECSCDKDLNNITRYVSKYVSKGVFESPFVGLGLFPKVFRCISHGVGRGIVDDVRYDVFRSYDFQMLRSISVDSLSLTGDLARTSVPRKYISLGVHNIINEYLNHELYESLTSIVINGYRYSLPRYCRDIITGSRKPNLLSYSLQNYIRICSEHQEQELLYRHLVGLFYPFEAYPRSLSEIEVLLGPEEYSYQASLYYCSKRLQNFNLAKERYIQLKNHYKRSMNLQFVS